MLEICLNSCEVLSAQAPAEMGRKKKTPKKTPKKPKPRKVIDSEPEYSKKMACLTFTTTRIDQWYAELAKQYYENPDLEVSWKDWKGKNDVTTQVEITVSGPCKKAPEESLSVAINLYMTVGKIMIQGKTLETWRVEEYPYLRDGVNATIPQAVQVIENQDVPTTASVDDDKQQVTCELPISDGTRKQLYTVLESPVAATCEPDQPSSQNHVPEVNELSASDNESITSSIPESTAANKTPKLSKKLPTKTSTKLKSAKSKKTPVKLPVPWMDNITNTINKLDQRVSSVGNAVEAMKSSMESILKTFVADIKGVKEEVASLKADVESKHQELSTTCQQLTNACSTSAVDLVTVRAEFSLMKQDVESVKTKVDSIRDKQHTSDPDIEAIKADLKDTKNTITSLSADLQSVKSQPKASNLPQSPSYDITFLQLLNSVNSNIVNMNNTLSSMRPCQLPVVQPQSSTLSYPTGQPDSHQRFVSNQPSTSQSNLSFAAASSPRHQFVSSQVPSAFPQQQFVNSHSNLSYASAASPQHRHNAPTHQVNQQPSQLSSDRQSNANYQPDRPPPAQTQSKPKLTVVMDSNRKSIDFRQLFPNFDVQVLPSGTIEWARRAIQKINSPDVVILHMGTNDLDNGLSGDECAKGLMDLASELRSSHPNAVVHISNLLPRKDGLNDACTRANEVLNSQFASTIRHPDILSQNHLYDDRHLNRYRMKGEALTGTQLFSKSLYCRITNSQPDELLLRNSRRWSKS